MTQYLVENLLVAIAAVGCFLWLVTRLLGVSLLLLSSSKFQILPEIF